ncbi:MAG: ATP-binding cassette domain-containing protein [Pseudomonadota bacterium]
MSATEPIQTAATAHKPAATPRRLAPVPDARGPESSGRKAQPLLRTRDLVKTYAGGHSVLAGISLEIAAGERVALIGANGAGKSTLLKSLIGLHGLSGGSVRVFDTEFTAQPTGKQRSAIRRHIGFVFQSHCLVRRLSALSNVVHGKFGLPGSWRAWHQAIAPASWRAEAARALEAVNLIDKAYERADHLSGGQQQRVAIARALIRQPRLFIADEPAASLDPAAGHDVMRRLSDLSASRGSTLIFTSHDMQHALDYADRVIALKGGTVFLDRATRDLDTADLEPVFHG